MTQEQIDDLRYCEKTRENINMVDNSLKNQSHLLVGCVGSKVLTNAQHDINKVLEELQKKLLNAFADARKGINDIIEGL